MILPSTPGERRVLVVLRAGDESLHPRWFLNGRAESRNWDLHISYFGDLSRPYRIRSPDVTLSFEKGTKAIGTVACLEKLGQRVDDYDWIWLPDDDLTADLPTLNRFFEIVAEHGLDLAQPALGAGSYASHKITLQRPHMKLRYTTYVEIMAACFSREAFRLCAPYFGATVTSWGPDILFPKLLGYPQRSIAIVDATPVIHTRPSGRGPNIRLAQELGVDPNQEAEDFKRRHQVQHRVETWGGLDLSGNPVEGIAEIDRHMVESQSFAQASSRR